MRNKTTILIISLVFIVVIAVSIFFLKYASPSCNSMYNEIENDLEENNYCVQDSDCDVIMLGGTYIKFGCYHFINTNVDKDLIYTKMQEYNSKCSKIINKCARAPNTTCVSSKCVSLK